METPKQYYLSGLVQRAFRHNVIIVIVIIGRLDEGFLTSHVDFKKSQFCMSPLLRIRHVPYRV